MPEARNPRLHVERRTGERTDAYQALCDYCRMGASRSLRALHRQYEGASGADSVPTKNLNTIERWSSRNDWVDRAAAYDEEVQKMLAEEEERALKEGLASVGRRIIRLDRMAQLLEELLHEDDMHSLERVKGIGSGQDGTFERIEEVQFNEGIFRQLRGIYDDIAKEVGGRDQVPNVV